MRRTANLDPSALVADSAAIESVSSPEPAMRGPGETSTVSPGEEFLHDVLMGLSDTPKRLQPKYFYDQRGSALFDRICELEEYYPFQSELALLPAVAKALRGILTDEYAMVEFGAGSLQKVKPLLDEIPGIRSFTPIDISGEHLHQACDALRVQYPELLVQAVVGDFCEPVELTDSPYCPLGFFPGSTIGNFSPEQAHRFLVNAGETLGQGSYMLIGVDTKKSPDILHAAYNDPRGVTAGFNRNILARINRELDGDFDTDSFEHYAFYNPVKGRVEMHLISATDQQVKIAGREFRFHAGESIHTENSYKYSPGEFIQLARGAGWTLEAEWLAMDALFATFLLRRS